MEISCCWDWYSSNSNTLKRILFVTDGIEGIDQAEDKIKVFGELRPGLYFAEVKELTRTITITTYQSWSDPYFPFDPTNFDLLILNETHMSLSKIRLSATQKYCNATLLVLTASPEYSDDKSLHQYYKSGYQIDIKQRWMTACLPDS